MLHFSRQACEADICLMFFLESTVRFDRPVASSLRHILESVSAADNPNDRQRSEYDRVASMYSIYHNPNHPSCRIVRELDQLAMFVSAFILHAGVEIGTVQKGDYWKRMAYVRLYRFAYASCLVKNRALPESLRDPEEFGIGEETNDDTGFVSHAICGRCSGPAKSRKTRKTKDTMTRSAVIKRIKAHQVQDTREERQNPCEDSSDKAADNRVLNHIADCQLQEPLSSDRPVTPERSIASSNLKRSRNRSSSPTHTDVMSSTEAASTLSRPLTPHSSGASSTLGDIPLAKEISVKHREIEDLHLSESLTSANVQATKKPIENERQEMAIPNADEDTWNTACSTSIFGLTSLQDTSATVPCERQLLSTDLDKSSLDSVESSLGVNPVNIDSEDPVHTSVAPTYCCSVRDEVLIEIETMKIDLATVRALSTLRSRKRTKSMPIFVELINGED